MKLLDDIGLTTQIAYLKNYIRKQLKDYHITADSGITGPITMATDNCIEPGSLGDYIEFYHQNSGSSLTVDNSGPEFALHSYDGTSYSGVLRGTPTSLNWIDEPILTYPNAIDISSSIVAVNGTTICTKQRVVRIGPLVLASLNLKIAGNISGTATLMTGFPSPIHAAASSIGNRSAYPQKIAVLTSGELIVDQGFRLSDTSYYIYSGFIAYFSSVVNNITFNIAASTATSGWLNYTVTYTDSSGITSVSDVNPTSITIKSGTSITVHNYSTESYLGSTLYLKIKQNGTAIANLTSGQQYTYNNINANLTFDIDIHR